MRAAARAGERDIAARSRRADAHHGSSAHPILTRFRHGSLSLGALIVAMPTRVTLAAASGVCSGMCLAWQCKGRATR